MRLVLATIALTVVAGCATPPDYVKLSTCVVGGGCVTMTQLQLREALLQSYLAGTEAGHDSGEVACSVRTGNWYRYFAP